MTTIFIIYSLYIFGVINVDTYQDLLKGCALPAILILIVAVVVSDLAADAYEKRGNRIIEAVKEARSRLPKED
jgi:uncharacterized integral membrane protein